MNVLASTDILQRTLLVLTSALFAANLAQSIMYLPVADEREPGDHMRHWRFYACMFAFFGAMLFAILAPSLTLMWVAVELTTLVSAPLIAYRRSRESLEAMWKYLLICSIGIGLALFGTMLVMHATTTGNATWHKAGFAFVLAGYGTKMGLAPFHTWLPDAHSEAPAPVSALLSGALLNCSFFAIVRVRAAIPPDAAAFCDWATAALGLLSVAVAAAFMVRQTDYKRLLAYSSVEHMGIIALIFACSGIFRDHQALLETALLAHIVSHSLAKTALFHTAGNLLLAFGTRAIAAVQGLGTTMRREAALWTVLVVLICGMPPSPLFLTELGLVFSSAPWIAATLLVLLFIVFAAMTRAALTMSMGRPAARPLPLPRRLAAVPSMLLGALVGGGAFATAAIVKSMIAKGGAL
ncbi:MAG: hypothetical protein J6U17_03105 [Kiritimatiellae bacterium]|nr:hypothetical protein [Kiritimatiellia bacterium]